MLLSVACVPHSAPCILAVSLNPFGFIYDHSVCRQYVEQRSEDGDSKWIETGMDASGAAPHSKWMGSLVDNCKVSDLNIPGSHDTMSIEGKASGACNAIGGYVICQDRTLDEQLQDVSHLSLGTLDDDALWL